jgi:hypothetical protein
VTHNFTVSSATSFSDQEQHFVRVIDHGVWVQWGSLTTSRVMPTIADVVKIKQLRTATGPLVG